MVCRTIGECRFGAPTDREFGDGITAPGEPAQWAGAKQFAYVRYEPRPHRRRPACTGLGDVKPENLQLMDSIAFVNDIQRVGRAFAGKVTQDHFEGF